MLPFRLCLVVSGSVEDFDASAFKAELSELTAVPERLIEVEYGPGSVVVNATMHPESDETSAYARNALHSQTEATLSSSLGVTVETIVVRPELPSPPPPPADGQAKIDGDKNLLEHKVDTIKKLKKKGGTLFVVLSIVGLMIGMLLCGWSRLMCSSAFCTPSSLKRGEIFLQEVEITQHDALTFDSSPSGEGGADGRSKEGGSLTGGAKRPTSAALKRARAGNTGRAAQGLPGGGKRGAALLPAGAGTARSEELEHAAGAGGRGAGRGGTKSIREHGAAPEDLQSVGVLHSQC